jgi:ubiquinone/menaquinone biosynthesis C-methylase UbiE
MLDQARALASKLSLTNVEWHEGDVYRLPFPDNSFDVVSCRFAFHHLQEPGRALVEMIRVCRTGGRIVLCDGLASDDPAKARALNAMELLRDPSTVAFRSLKFYIGLFAAAGLPQPAQVIYQAPVERDALVAASYPANGDRAALRRMIDASVEGDLFGMNARREGGTVLMSYPAVILTAPKPSSPRQVSL